jgi:hypothetical protein
LTNNIVFHKLQPYKVNKQEDDMAKQKTNMEAAKATSAVEQENQAYIKQLGKLCEAAGLPADSRYPNGYNIRYKPQATEADRFVIRTEYPFNSPSVQILRIAAANVGLCSGSVNDNNNATIIQFTEEEFAEKIQQATTLAGQLRSIYEKTNFVINPSPKEGETSVPNSPSGLKDSVHGYLEACIEELCHNRVIVEAKKSRLSYSLNKTATDVSSLGFAEKKLLENALDSHCVLKLFTQDIMGQSRAPQR